MNSYTRQELLELGIQMVGEDICIDRSVRFFGAAHIRIGNRVRIDCFCLISAGSEGITIGNNIHIAAGCYLFGSGEAITFHDFSGLSSRAVLYTSSDDYLDGFLTNPTVPDVYRKASVGPIILDRHAIVGCGSVLLPGVTLGWGAAVGALTVVRKSVAECEIVCGNPMRKLPRKRDGERLRRLEAEYLRTWEARQ